MNFKYTPYSASKLGVFQTCPKKFEYQYIQKIPVERKPQKHFDKGKLIHMMFEHNTSDLRVLREKSPREFNEIISNKLLTKEDIKEYINIFNSFKKNTKLLQIPRLFAELPIGIDYSMQLVSYDSKDAILRGFIDDIRGQDTKSGPVLVVNDWKTGKIPDQIKWDQLVWYSIAMFSRMPEMDKMLLNYVYVEQQQIKSKLVHRKDIKRYQDALFNVIDKVEQTETFEKHESGLCQFCDYFDICQL